MTSLTAFVGGAGAMAYGYMEDLYNHLAEEQLQCTAKLINDEEFIHLRLTDVTRLHQRYYLLWQNIQGTSILSNIIQLQLLVCNSLLQLELVLALKDEIPHTGYSSNCLKQLVHTLSIYLNVDDEFKVYTAIQDSHSNDNLGHNLARLYTIMSLIDLTSVAEHGQAAARLGKAHTLLASSDHVSCRDWFECLLKTKALLLREESKVPLDYFNGWWTASHITSIPHGNWWASGLTHLWNGNFLAQKGKLHLALCKYRQCLLTADHSTICLIPALFNSALVFQKLNNTDAELEARILLFKTSIDLKSQISGCTIVWRKEGYISSCSDVRTHLLRNAYITAQRALSCRRPKLALVVLEPLSDLLPLAGVAYGFAPRLLMLKSLIGVGRYTEAMQLCFKIVLTKHDDDYLLNPQTSLQLSQALLVGSVAGLQLHKYEIAYFLIIRSIGISSLLYTKEKLRCTRQCSMLMQIGLTILSILIIGCGRLNSALSLLMSALVDVPLNVLNYNKTLLKVKMARTSSSISDLIMSQQAVNLKRLSINIEEGVNAVHGSEANK